MVLFGRRKKVKLVKEADALLKEADKVLRKEREIDELLEISSRLMVVNANIGQRLLALWKHRLELAPKIERVKEVRDEAEGIRKKAMSREGVSRLQELTREIQVILSQSKRIATRIKAIEEESGEEEELAEYERRTLVKIEKVNAKLEAKSEEALAEQTKELREAGYMLDELLRGTK